MEASWSRLSVPDTRQSVRTQTVERTVTAPRPTETSSAFAAPSPPRAAPADDPERHDRQFTTGQDAGQATLAAVRGPAPATRLLDARRRVHARAAARR